MAGSHGGIVVDLGGYLVPHGGILCAWRLAEGGWQVTVTRARAGQRRHRIYDVDAGTGHATLVGEIAHRITSRWIEEHRRLRADRHGRRALVIRIPRVLCVGQEISVAGGAAVVSLARVGIGGLGRLRGSVVTLAARERGGASGELDLLEGIGETRVVSDGRVRRVVYVEANGATAGRRPSFWGRLRLGRSRLGHGAASTVL